MGGDGGGGEVSGERDLLYWSNKTVARLELVLSRPLLNILLGPWATVSHCQPVSSGNIIEIEPPPLHNTNRP